MIRSVNLKQISALKDLCLKLSSDVDIDLVMVYSSGDLLHLNVFEVKKNMLPWDAKSRPPNKKAENQLTEDVDILVALLAGTPPDKIVIAILL